MAETVGNWQIRLLSLYYYCMTKELIDSWSVSASDLVTKRECWVVEWCSVHCTLNCDSERAREKEIHSIERLRDNSPCAIYICDCDLFCKLLFCDFVIEFSVVWNIHIIDIFWLNVILSRTTFGGKFSTALMKIRADGSKALRYNKFHKIIF